MVSETARVRAPGRAKGKWAGQGRERFLSKAGQRVGGARAVGGVGSLPRREGEGQPGTGPGRTALEPGSTGGGLAPGWWLACQRG